MFQANLLDRARRLGKAKTISDIYPIALESIIFSHSFAKAFWGEESGAIIAIGETGETAHEQGGKEWQYHLQQMMLREKPLEYLKQFLSKPPEDTIVEK